MKLTTEIAKRLEEIYSYAYDSITEQKMKAEVKAIINFKNGIKKVKSS